MKPGSASALVCLIAMGCRGGTEYRNPRQPDVLPYTVRVKVDQKFQVDEEVREVKPYPGVLVPSLLREEKRGEIEESLVRALYGQRTFAEAYASTRAVSVEPDLELQVNIVAPAQKGLGGERTKNIAWVNAFLWLLAGFPGWLIEDTEVDPQIKVDCRLVRTIPGNKEWDIHQVTPLKFDDDNDLNFFHRAGAWQYVQQIVIPPFWIGSDEEAADQTLWGRYLERMQREIGRELNRADGAGLVRENKVLPFVRVVELERTALVLVFSAAQVQEFKLDKAGEPQEVQWRAIDPVRVQDPLLSREDVVRALAKHPEVPRAYELFQGGAYQFGNASEVDLAVVKWKDGEPPTRLRVSFRPAGEEWTWTPRVTSFPKNRTHDTE